MNILITGVGGLLGSNFSKFLLDNTDYNVIGIDNFSGGYRGFVDKRVKLYNIDLKEPINIEEKVDYIFHFAAFAAEGLSPFIRNYVTKNNVETSNQVINFAINNSVKKVIFTSSMAVYGRGKAPFDENDIPNPIDPYGVSKLSTEIDLKCIKEQFNIDYCIIRPHNVYGIQQNIWDRYRNVLGIWMRKLLNNEPITVFGDGLQRRAFTYIDDILQPLLNSIDSRTNGHIINLGGIYPISLVAAANILKDIVGFGEPIEFLEKRHEVHQAFSTYDKSVELLDFSHKTDIKDGLIKMWEWAKNQPEREVINFDYEVERGLYVFWKN